MILKEYIYYYIVYHKEERLSSEVEHCFVNGSLTNERKNSFLQNTFFEKNQWEN